MERYVAIDNVCAWPNLTKMPDGSLVATIFNQPCHGAWEGDVECWASEDGGRSWQLRGTPAPHEPGTNRMNVAAGLAGNGDLVVIASGWSPRPPRSQPQTPPPPAEVLSPWICRSSDGGRTWTQAEGFPAAPEANMGPMVIPFGDVLQADDGALCVSAYAGGRGDDSTHHGRTGNSAYLFRSDDDGRTWNEGVIIGQGDYNETAPLHLGGGRWLAACRTLAEGALNLFASEDDGRTWRFARTLSQPAQHPAHLLRLPDRRLLLTYGNRCPGHESIDIAISQDEGVTWSPPKRLVTLETADLGYPATVPGSDGKLCTAWYSSRIASHQRYHMGTLVWDLEA